MQKIKKSVIHTSAAFSIPSSKIKQYLDFNKKPEVGDVILGEVARLGQHSSLENISGRIHTIYNGSRAVFVYGNRYAPDYYEGFVPDNLTKTVDLLARSGIVGVVKTKNAIIKDPTQINFLGYLCDSEGKVINTKDHPLIKPKVEKKSKNRSRLILVCGTGMNSGKSMAAAACCWALSSMGYSVRGSKITGTASLQDILHMNDSGADFYNDFTYLGYPSTYMLDENQLLDVFNKIDLKYANNPKNYWVVELSDGIGQRETFMLLNSQEVRNRIGKLIFTARDAFGAIGGLNILNKELGLVPNALSGICSSSPLYIRELKHYTDIPVFNSADPNLKEMADILIH